MSRTPRWETRFLETYANTMNVKASCMAAGISRPTYYLRLNRCEQFAARVAQAKEDALDQLEEVARKRALSGASDRMIEFLLKAHRREIYGDRVVVEHEQAQAEAKRLAAELGLDADRILQDAERIVTG